MQPVDGPAASVCPWWFARGQRWYPVPRVHDQRLADALMMMHWLPVDLFTYIHSGQYY